MQSASKVIYYKGKALRPIAGGDGTMDLVVQKVLTELGRERIRGQEVPVWGTRTVSSTPSTLSYMGPGSLFGALGLEREVINTRVNINGIADLLPVQLSDVEWPQFAYFTGFGAGTGSEPTGVCDDPPTPGTGATCIQTAQFGRFSRQTRVLDISNMNRRINRGEMTDLVLMNGPMIGGSGGITRPSSVGGEQANWLNEAYMRMAELAPEFQTWFARMIYEGNPTNNTGGGGYKEFPGLDILINTGHTDAVTGTTCPSLDSAVVNWNYGNVSGGTAANYNINKMIDLLTAMYRYFRQKAADQNMGAVNWVLVMRPGLFYELTAAWPCNYATYRCVTNATQSNVNVNIDGMDLAQMRDALRQGQYLVVDGTQINVVLDNTIREDTNTTNSSVTNGSLASDVYMLPLSIMGGRSVLYWEVFDFANNVADLAALAPQLGGTFFWTDQGRYLWHLKPPTNWCVQVMGLIKPRLILRTPHLAARITNVVYQQAWHDQDPIVTDPYFVRGGNTTGRTAPTYSVNLGGWTTVS